MKKQILFIFILCYGTAILHAQSKVWDFPVGPGSKEWGSAKSLDERLFLYNIPTSLSATMATEDLVITCLNYPEWRMIFTRNSIMQGYEFIKSQFNGFRELELRKDAGRFLLAAYTKKNYDEIVQITNRVDLGRFIQSILYIEILLSQGNIINNMDKSDQEALKDQAIKSFESETRLMEYYGLPALEMSALIMAKLLIMESQTNPLLTTKLDDEILLFVKNAGTRKIFVWNNVYDLAKGFF
jgi:hypothetical protein